MPSEITDYGADAFVSALIGKTTVIPNTFYMALMTEPPDPSSDATTLSEPTVGGYARVPYANSAVNWSPPSSGTISNLTDIVWPLATADWPVVTHYAVTDALTGGNIYLFGALQVPRMILSGHQSSFSIGLLTLSCISLPQPIVSHA